MDGGSAADGAWRSQPGKAARRVIAPIRRYWARSGSWDVSIVLVAASVIASVWIVTLERIEHERRDAIETAYKQNSNLAIALEAHTVRTLKSVDQALHQVVREYGDKGVQLDLARLIADGVIDGSILENVAVLDEHGTVVLNSRRFQATNGMDRAFFAVHREHDDSTTYIDRPLLSRVSGKWVIPVSRRISKPDGSFGGIALANVDPYYFTSLYKQAQLGQEDLIAIVGLDGITRARRAGETQSFGQDRRRNTLFAKQAEAPNGSFASKGGLEGVPRYMSYRTLKEYPLIVQVGTSVHDSLLEFGGRKRAYYAGSVTATLVIILFSGLLLAALARQRTAIRSLSESEERFRVTFNQAAAGIILTSDDGRIVDANEAFCMGLGYDKQDVIGASIALFVNSDELKSMLEDRERLRSGEASVVTREIAYKRKDRSRGWANRSVTLLRDADGRPQHFLSVFHDVTASKEARRQLEYTNTVLITQQQVSPDAILLVDEKGRIASYNDKFLDFWSIPRELALAGDDGPVLRTVVDQVSDPESFLQRVRHLYEHRQQQSVDEVRTKDGRIMDRYSAPVIGSNGTYFGRVWYFRDVTERRRSEVRLRESEQRFRRMAETIGEVFWIGSPDASSIQYVSPAFETVWGRTCTEVAEQPRLWMEAIETEDRPLAERSLAALAEGTPYDIEYRIRRPDGVVRWINDRGYAMRDDSGVVVLTSGLAADITDRKRIADRQRLSDKVIASIADGVVVTDAERRILFVNEAFSRLTGYSAGEAIGRTPAMLKSGRQDAAFYSEMWRLIDKTGHWQGEMWNRRKSGELYPELLSITAVHDGGGDVSHYVGVFNDISAFKQYEERLHHLAHHDALTGLPNRVLFQQRFRESVGRARRSGGQTAVLFLDLDHFKNINDSLGHDVGDRLLLAVGKRLTENVREVDTVARFGGDEFALLLDFFEDNRALATVAQKLIDALARPFQIGEHQFFISASIGISCYPQDGKDIEVLFKNADTAMYRAKTEGRNNYQFFSVEMNARMLENLLMSNGLRRALERGEFLLHFQPRLDLVTGRVSGAEALIRWANPEMGLVPPGRFIPLAEESGLIEPIGEWVLKAACRQMRAWLDAGLPMERIAVNLSARQFRHPDLTRRVAAILRETGLPARHLELEVTESMVMHDPEKTTALLAGIKAMGIAIAIDDFGTGYSSLSYLKRFPIDFLKIDQSFVRGVPDDADDAAIVRAIVAMAKSLKLRVIAEGVETPEQRAFLEAQGCEEGQGYLFSRPVPAADFEALIGMPGLVREAEETAS
jgi:diguanylate cyclase (GGDEF)-like protein/PAS domain S-box-containing protein